MGLARRIGKLLQPVGPCRKEDSSDASNERRSCCGVGVTKGSASQERLDSAPAAACGDAWVETPPRLIALGTAIPRLGQHPLGTDDCRSGAATFGRGGVFDVAHALQDRLGQVLVGEMLETRSFD
jgi:hypothetical protein